MHIYMYIYIPRPISAYMHVCVYVCACILAHTHTRMHVKFVTLPSRATTVFTYTLRYSTAQCHSYIYYPL